MKNILTNNNHIKQLEKLARIGYWEWQTSSDSLFLSEGLKNIFSFLNDEIDLKSFFRYLKNTYQYNACESLFQLIKEIKSTNQPNVKVLSLELPDQTTKYLEFNIQKIDSTKNDYFTGTVQEVNERIKYKIVKEKEIQFEKKISEIASRFLEYNNFSTDLIKTLSEVGQMLRSTQVKILNIANNNINELYVWRKNEISQSKYGIIEYLPPTEKKYLIELLKEKRVIYFNDTNDLPQIASSTRDFFNKNKNLSVIASAITIDNQTIGALMVSRNGNHPRWDFSDIHIIKMTSLILGNALKQNRIQKDLKTSEKRLQFALLAGNLGTWELDLKRNISFFDEKFANIFGYTNTNINKTQNWLIQNIHPNFKLLYTEAIEECLEGHKNYYSLELKVKCKNGNYKWVHDWGIITKTDENNIATRMVGVIQDISIRKKMENQLIVAKKQAENNEKLKTAFLANVSHEIRTPMNGITGFAELLYHNQVSECDKQKYFEVIWKNSTRLLDMINNILDISKLETNQIQLFEHEHNLNRILDEVEQRIITNTLPKKNLTISFEKTLDEHSAYINIDESRLKQILINIIGNALKFTKAGFVKIKYKLNNNGLLEFSIQDSGFGIDEQQADVIFKRFGQTTNAVKLNRGGSGLGLPITKGILDIMDGEIWFKSQKAVGSTFYFTIPYKPTRLKIESL